MAVSPSSATTDTRTEKGISLARGPALILGTILQVAGLYFLYKEHTFPPLSNFPNGAAPVHSKVFLGIFGANGWTGLLTASAGGLLLFGAAQHLLAKTMSLIVGVALGAAAIISLISGNVLGLAAANHLTELAWGAASLILLFNTAIPRRRREVVVDKPVDRAQTARAAPATAGTGADERDRARHPSDGATVESRDGEGSIAGRDAGDHVERDDAEAPVATRDSEATAIHQRETRPPAET